MVDRVTQLIEMALSSTTDSEKLAALSQAKKIYKNNGVVLPKRVVRETTTVPQTVDATEIRTLKEALQKSEDLRAKLVKDNHTLSADNAVLKKQVLEANFAADAEVIHDFDRRKKREQYVAAGLAVILFAGIAILMVM